MNFILILFVLHVLRMGKVHLLTNLLVLLAIKKKLGLKKEEMKDHVQQNLHHIILMKFQSKLLI